MAIIVIIIGQVYANRQLRLKQENNVTLMDLRYKPRNGFRYAVESMVDFVTVVVETNFYNRVIVGHFLRK